MRIVIPVLVCMLIFLGGCSSIGEPNISKQDIANICNIDEELISIVNSGPDHHNQLQFILETESTSSQGVYTDYNKISKNEYMELVQLIKENPDRYNYKEHSIGEGSIIFDQNYRKIAMYNNGQIYTVSSTIEGCNTEEKIIEIASLIADRTS